jgi:hypothetical protein
MSLSLDALHFALKKTKKFIHSKNDKESTQQQQQQDG